MSDNFCYQMDATPAARRFHNDSIVDELEGSKLRVLLNVGSHFERNEEQRRSLPIKFTVKGSEEDKDDSGSSYSSMETLKVFSSPLSIKEPAQQHFANNVNKYSGINSDTSDVQNSGNPVFFFESINDNNVDDDIEVTSLSTPQRDLPQDFSSPSSPTSSKFLNTTHILSADHRRISLPSFYMEPKLSTPSMKSKLSASLRSLINIRKDVVNKTSQQVNSDSEKSNAKGKKTKTGKKLKKIKNNCLTGSFGSLEKQNDGFNSHPRCASVEPEIFTAGMFADKQLHIKDVKKKSFLDQKFHQKRKDLTLSEGHERNFVKRSSLSMSFFSKKHYLTTQNAEDIDETDEHHGSNLVNGIKIKSEDTHSEDNVVIYAHPHNFESIQKDENDASINSEFNWNKKEVIKTKISLPADARISSDISGKNGSVFKGLNDKSKATITMEDIKEDDIKEEKLRKVKTASKKKLPKVVIHYVKSASAISSAIQEQQEHKHTTVHIINSNTSPQFPLEYIQESSRTSDTPQRHLAYQQKTDHKSKLQSRPRVGSVDSTETSMNASSSTLPLSFFQNGPDPSGSEFESNYKLSDTSEQTSKAHKHHHYHHHSSPGKISHHKSSGSGSKSGGDGSAGKSGKVGLEKKKKTSSWYNHKKLVLSPSYKSRSEDFKRIFKALPADERLIVDYSCALQKDILIQGRMYLSQSWICFYANIFRWETVVMIQCKDITKLTKEKTARVIPNAIQICTKDDKYFFASFGSRDKVFLQLDLVRRNASNGLLMSKPEFWSWVHFYYGDDLALTSDDEDYVPLTSDDKNRFQLYLQMEMGQDQGIEIGKEALDLSAAAAASRATTTPTSSNRSPTCNGIANSTTLNDDVESFNDDDGGCSADVAKDDEEEEEEGEADYRECEGSEDEESSSGDDLVDYCSKHSHFSIDVLDEAYDLTVDDVFQHVFSDSQIYREFIKTKKTFDVSLNPWSEELDEKGRKVRNISYTLTLDFSIGPKHSPSTEKQVMHTESEPGRFYLIDCECVNEGIPYGENFFITNRYCLSRLSDNRSRLKITSQINYKKNVWGFIKNFLEKNVTAGIISTFSVLADLLRLESDRHLISLSQSPSLKQHNFLRRRRVVGENAGVENGVGPSSVTPSSPVADQAPVHKQTSIHVSSIVKNTDSKPSCVTLADHPKFTMDVLVRLVCVVLVVLMFFNAVFFYKLWSLEKSATNMLKSKVGGSQDDDLLSSLSSSMTANPLSYRRDVYEDLLKKPRLAEKLMKNVIGNDWTKSDEADKKKILTSLEIKEWKNVLSSTIQLVDHLRLSLIRMKNQLGQLDDRTFGADANNVNNNQPPHAYYNRENKEKR